MNKATVSLIASKRTSGNMAFASTPQNYEASTN